jgi:hypothetical protein
MLLMISSAAAFSSSAFKPPGRRVGGWRPKCGNTVTGLRLLTRLRLTLGFEFKVSLIVKLELGQVLQGCADAFALHKNILFGRNSLSKSPVEPFSFFRDFREICLTPLLLLTLTPNLLDVFFGEVEVFAAFKRRAKSISPSFFGGIIGRVDLAHE